MSAAFRRYSLLACLYPLPVSFDYFWPVLQCGVCWYKRVNFSWQNGQMEWLASWCFRSSAISLCLKEHISQWYSPVFLLCTFWLQMKKKVVRHLLIDMWPMTHVDTIRAMTNLNMLPQTIGPLENNRTMWTLSWLSRGWNGRWCGSSSHNFFNGIVRYLQSEVGSVRITVEDVSENYSLLDYVKLQCYRCSQPLKQAQFK